MAAKPQYSAPALDKGLDILELLAEAPNALSQSDIADATGRTTGQIFRMLSTLERRGYIFRDRQSGLYLLAMKLFELAHQHPPVRALISVALPVMHELAEQTQQSCNLAVLDGPRVRVIAQAESPADVGFWVRVGAAFDIESTTTGTILTNETAKALMRPDTDHAGVIDVVAAVRNSTGTVAALTVPYVAATDSTASAERVLQLASAAAQEISAALRGEEFGVE
ncbi:MAG: IclR family transcriptional regulator [Rhodoglobus sp.]